MTAVARPMAVAGAAAHGARRRIARGFRALRTGLAFATFGVGALIVAGVGFPMLHVLGGGRETRERRAQYLVHLSFRLFVRFMTVLGLIRVSFVGSERLRGASPALVIANHPTLIDVVLLIAAMPQADCVVKRAAWHNRFLRGIVAGTGYISNSDGPGFVDACVERLRRGRWLVVFPEGTRSPRGGLGAFRRGVAHVAFGSGCDIVPVVVTCDPPTLVKEQRWYTVPDRRAELTVKVGDRFRLATPAAPETSVTAARARTAEIRSRYEAALGHGPR
jgi:1-acyl-sn-glycerol-3-phosphate acyltransferase